MTDRPEPNAKAAVHFSVGDVLAALLLERYGPLADLEAERHADPPATIARRRRRKLLEKK